MKYLSLNENVREEFMSGRREGEKKLVLLIIIRTLSQVLAIHSLNT
jgi:hypothetical protein